MTSEQRPETGDHPRPHSAAAAPPRGSLATGIKDLAAQTEFGRLLSANSLAGIPLAYALTSLDGYAHTMDDLLTAPGYGENGPREAAILADARSVGGERSRRYESHIQRLHHYGALLREMLNPRPHALGSLSAGLVGPHPYRLLRAPAAWSGLRPGEVFADICVLSLTQCGFGSTLLPSGPPAIPLAHPSANAA